MPVSEWPSSAARVGVGVAAAAAAAARGLAAERRRSLARNERGAEVALLAAGGPPARQRRDTIELGRVGDEQPRLADGEAARRELPRRREEPRHRVLRHGAHAAGHLVDEVGVRWVDVELILLHRGRLAVVEHAGLGDHADRLARRVEGPLRRLPRRARRRERAIEDLARLVEEERLPAHDVRHEGALAQRERELERAAAREDDGLEAAVQHVRPHDPDERLDRHRLHLAAAAAEREDRLAL